MKSLPSFLILCFLLSFNSALYSQDAINYQKKERFLSIYASAGYTSFTFKEENFDEVINSHNNQWRNTNNYDFGISLHPNEDWTFSLNYSEISASAITRNIYIITATDTIAGILEDNISIRSFGISAEKGLFRSESFSTGFLLGADLFNYQNNGVLVVDEFILDGTDISLRLGAFFEVSLSPHVSVNFKGQYVISYLGNPNYQVVNPRIPVFVDTQNLSRLEFNLGLRINFLRNSNSKNRGPVEDDEYVPQPRFD